MVHVCGRDDCAGSDAAADDDIYDADADGGADADADADDAAANDEEDDDDASYNSQEDANVPLTPSARLSMSEWGILG